MSKRFTDTDKYKKAFIRGLPGAYKLLWDYLYHDCDHAGVWHKDFEIAQIYLGKDMPINEEKAIELFNQGKERIKFLDGGRKWLILPFIGFQYGKLNPENRAHSSVLKVLEKAGIKGLVSPLKGAMDKEKDKDKDKVKEGGVGGFDSFWTSYPKKKGKGKAEESWKKINPSIELQAVIVRSVEAHKEDDDWKKENGKYIPFPATWLNQKRWLDEVKSMKKESVTI